jgi:hypothetical protein
MLTGSNIIELFTVKLHVVNNFREMLFLWNIFYFIFKNSYTLKKNVFHPQIQLFLLLKMIFLDLEKNVKIFEKITKRNLNNAISTNKHYV